MIISQTPCRISFVGGGSDYPDYWRNYGPAKFISMGISSYVWVIINYNEYSRIPNVKLNFLDTFEEKNLLSDIENEYVRAALIVSGFSSRPQNMYIWVRSDVPLGSGLGSSSAISVGLLRCFNQSYNLNELFEASLRMEICTMNKPIGWQDQLACVFGGFASYTINSSGEVTRFSIGEGYANWLLKHIVLFYIPGQVSHEPRAGITNFDAVFTYIKEQTNLVDMFLSSVMSHNIKEVGRILDEAWKLKILSHSSATEDMIELYNYCMSLGAIGGKFTGSLIGGTHLLLIVDDPDKRIMIADALALRNIKRVHFGLSEIGSTLYSVGFGVSRSFTVNIPKISSIRVGEECWKK
ncbi:MAG: hypothetical protein QXS29_09720 [Nitrososphaeria archaeon]